MGGVGRFKSDLEEVKSSQAEVMHEVHQALRMLERRLVNLEADVGHAQLVNETLTRLIVQKGWCTPDELKELMHSIDIEDGVEDGRITPPGKATICAGCHKPLPPNRPKCSYCGTVTLKKLKQPPPELGQ